MSLALVRLQYRSTNLTEQHPHEGVRYFAASLGCSLTTVSNGLRSLGMVKSSVSDFHRATATAKDAWTSALGCSPEAADLTGWTPLSLEMKNESFRESPDLAPSDYHLFRSLQHYLEEKRYDDHLENDLRAFFAYKSPEFYAKGIRDLRRPSRATERSSRRLSSLHSAVPDEFYTFAFTHPFHPQSNGQAERFVDTFKRGLAKLKREEPTVDALQTFLMACRSTLCSSAPDQRSPAEAFLGRRQRT
ncbi:hypothetical protein RB195_018642 [Necator americanus]|uniref:Integrase catalytic domain-containing protein n=1 Tax=Necator americanus TaxID=51031 RepID=A0ABR1CCU8_NECAM